MMENYSTMEKALLRKPVISDINTKHDYVKTVIREDMAALIENGEVIEVRIFGANGIISGLFNDMENLSDEVMRFNGKNNIHFTLNPRKENPLLEMNKLQAAKTTTSGSDILKRSWLLIDIDPKRPSGTSSTDEEQAYALETARVIELLLTANGFPAPVCASSGNGIHLLYKIDMPNDRESADLIKSFLAALSMIFSDEYVEIDKSVHDAARLSRLYGSKNVKGENTAERPHRQSKLLQAPTESGIVTAEQLRYVISTFARNQELAETRKQSPGTHPSPAGKIFDVTNFIEKNALDVASFKEEADYKLWRIRCPFKEHEDKAAFIQQFNNGAITASCHHEKCTWDWKELRAKFDPKYAQRLAVHSEAAKTQLPEHLIPYNVLLDPDSSGIRINEKGNVLIYKGGENPRWETLTNFVPIPLEIIREIDGTGDDTKQTTIKVGGYLEGGKKLTPIVITSKQLLRNDWAIELDIKAIIHSKGFGNSDKLKEVVQRLSDSAVKTTIYSHLGFRTIEEKLCYLHSGGAIGMDSVLVNLSQNNMEGYVFEDTHGMTAEDRLWHIRKSLRLFDLHRHGNILFAYTFLAPLCEVFSRHGNMPPFSLWLYGRSGTQKTTVAALLMSFYGKGFSKANLPLSFNDTENSLTKKLSLCKDSLAVIDDVIHPTAYHGDIRRYKKLAQDMVFNIANRTGRGRMKADESLKKTLTPQGMVIFTAEYPFDNIAESTTARLLHLEFEKGSVDLDVLTDCQKNAVSFNITMALYIEWLILNMDGLTADLHKNFEELRSDMAAELGSGTNMKLVEICVFMYISLEYALHYFVSVGAVDLNYMQTALVQIRADLQAIVKKQISSITSMSPTQQFMDVVGNLFADGTIYTKHVSGDGADQTSGKNFVGWHDSVNYYFLVGESTGSIFLAVRQHYRQHDIDFNIQSKDLCKRLVDEGIVIDADEGRHNKVKTIAGKSHRVLVIPKKAFETETPSHGDESDDYMDTVFPLD